MSTTKAGLNGVLQPPDAAGKRGIKKYIYQEPTAERLKRIGLKTLYYLAVGSSVVAIVTVFASLYFYTYYSEQVQQRIDSGFWHTRAGLYSAPHTLSKDQTISKKEVVEILRRSGYVENNSSGDVWNGNFAVKNDLIEIQDHNFYRTDAKKIFIEFKGKKINRINNGSAPLEQFEIHPELLTGRSEAKRGVNHALEYDQIPEILRKAILTAEDQRFFGHYGIDPQGIARAFYRNISDYELKQGGSTITQQLVKNTFLTPEKSFSRKISEAFISIALETKMSKQDIFALYCNEIYLGQYGASGIHGVEQAARTYFGKELKDLNLTEAAAIAAMIKNPNRLAPHKTGAEASRQRRNQIIEQMLENKLISPEEAANARTRELVLAKPKTDDKTIAPYFIDAATREMTAEFGEDILNTNFNRRVYTTVDTQLQNLAEETVRGQLNDLDKMYAEKGLKPQAVIVAIDPHNGHILALVGGRNYRESQFNRATDARRQPGSAFKPFVYAAAFEQGLTPVSTFEDKKTDFVYDGGRSYVPANYGGSYSNRMMTVKSALVRSSNVIAVEVAMRTGLGRVAGFARRFGFEDIETYPSLALGTMEATPLQVAAAYSVFANGGRRIEPTFIQKIVSGENDVIYHSEPAGEQIISPKTAYMLTDMMTGVVERGTARQAHGALGENVVFAGKTGSSKDGWFVGYTPNLVTVAWVGFDENTDLEMTGGEAALPLWMDFMQQVLAVRPDLGGRSFNMPKGLTTIVVDPETGMLAGRFCPQREKVAVPVSVAGNYHCFRHQPKVNDSIITADFDPEEYIRNTLVIPPETVSREIIRPENIKSPPEKPEKTGTENKNEQVEPAKKPASTNNERQRDLKTYWKSYEEQLEKIRGES